MRNDSWELVSSDRIGAVTGGIAVAAGEDQDAPTTSTAISKIIGFIQGKRILRQQFFGGAKGQLKTTPESYFCSCETQAGAWIEKHRVSRNPDEELAILVL